MKGNVSWIGRQEANRRGALKQTAVGSHKALHDCMDDCKLSSVVKAKPDCKQEDLGALTELEMSDKN